MAAAMHALPTPAVWPARKGVTAHRAAASCSPHCHAPGSSLGLEHRHLRRVLPTAPAAPSMAPARPGPVRQLCPPVCAFTIPDFPSLIPVQGSWGVWAVLVFAGSFGLWCVLRRGARVLRGGRGGAPVGCVPATADRRRRCRQQAPVTLGSRPLPSPVQPPPAPRPDPRLQRPSANRNLPSLYIRLRGCSCLLLPPLRAGLSARSSAGSSRGAARLGTGTWEHGGGPAGGWGRPLGGGGGGEGGGGGGVEVKVEEQLICCYSGSDGAGCAAPPLCGRE